MDKLPDTKIYMMDKSVNVLYFPKGLEILHLYNGDPGVRSLDRQPWCSICLCHDQEMQGQCVGAHGEGKRSDDTVTALFCG